MDRARNISPPNIVIVNSTNFDYWFGNWRGRSVSSAGNEMRGGSFSSGNRMRPHPFSSSFGPEVRFPAPHLRHTLLFRDNMHNISRESFLQNEEVLSLPDHYNDMRLDIDNMSYEELLRLGERIGQVGTGLLEKIIAKQLRTKIYMLSDNLEGSTFEGQKIELCIICQDEYKNKEEIGILQCGHEYHVDCIRKWLHEKNVCPLCKSKALPIG